MALPRVPWLLPLNLCSLRAERFPAPTWVESIAGLIGSSPTVRIRPSPFSRRSFAVPRIRSLRNGRSLALRSSATLGSTSSVGVGRSGTRLNGRTGTIGARLPDHEAGSDEGNSRKTEPLNRVVQVWPFVERGNRQSRDACRGIGCVASIQCDDVEGKHGIR